MTRTSDQPAPDEKDRQQRLLQLIGASEMNASFFMVDGLTNKQANGGDVAVTRRVMRIQRISYSVETVLQRFDDADARPPPVASFDQSTGSGSKSSLHPNASQRNGGGGRGGSSSSSSAAAAAAAARPDAGREASIKSPRPGRGSKADDGNDRG